MKKYLYLTAMALVPLCFTACSSDDGDSTPSYKTCPDANHPHLIDLGLPSGTKWACCNVGAAKPEDPGNHYAWGELEPKDVYNWNTYAYLNDSDGDGYVKTEEIVNIGSDIARTGYDVATVRLGAPWRMPSLAQVNELLDNCTSTWVTQNGVSGRRFIGRNGGVIFMPAAGNRWDENQGNAGSAGFYWSSTLYANSPNFAYSLRFYSGGGYSHYDGNRSDGNTVRPVQ